MLFVKPAPGLKVPDPERGDFLPDDGRKVPKNQYWHRRVHVGDVVLPKKDGKAKAVSIDSDERK